MLDGEQRQVVTVLEAIHLRHDLLDAFRQRDAGMRSDQVEGREASVAQIVSLGQQFLTMEADVRANRQGLQDLETSLTELLAAPMGGALGTLLAVSTAWAETLTVYTAVEAEDLGIAAGPMDRVVQAYEGLYLMDFRSERTPAAYTPLDPDTLPPMRIAWDPTGGAPSGSVHADTRERWQRGDPKLLRAMAKFPKLVDAGEGQGSLCMRIAQ